MTKSLVRIAALALAIAPCALPLAASEALYRDTARAVAGEPAAALNLTDLWHNAADPGWGVFLDHQGATLFAVLFVHDVAGHPTWFVMSEGVRQPDGSYTGDLYRTRGPAETALKHLEAVGTLRFSPGGASRASLLYTVGGVSHVKGVERYRFSPAARTCRWSPDPAKAAVERNNFTSLWHDPAEPGWGLALSHQAGSTFGVLFTYDANERPTWYVMASGAEKSRGAYTGELFRAGRTRLDGVGSMTLTFRSGNEGQLAYRLDGADVTKRITRQVFAPLTAHCAS